MTSSRRTGQPATGRQLRRLRGACEALLDSLSVPGTCDISELCAHLGARRGRPIRLLPVELQSSQLYGLWIATDVADLIVYEAHTSKPHQEHIIAHELSHMLCGHHSGGKIDDGTAEQLFPDISPDVVRGMLQRSGYSDHDEQEAETMASLILTRARRQVADPVPTASLEQAEAIARIESVVGPDPGACAVVRDGTDPGPA
ncbi:ImmA/IrrE family metallo-endopeptidase [Streptantibioticus ferralitis]|uniref:ImmA/IrrE family metallo-endopeptidase n=1 Tax=Streptantibioticus ferralitis TaxID=236510 RepID=A0ABT5YXA6_9ACTN|nr:ImmA/IrrE family metallo-endopeptidase [Streptantibioticus ferralitis]MDF2256108.1 ImmA/IrrE family metallo-endopeptidase [Streptantibioticus ferralitis]